MNDESVERRAKRTLEELSNLFYKGGRWQRPNCPCEDMATAVRAEPGFTELPLSGGNHCGPVALPSIAAFAVDIS